MLSNVYASDGGLIDPELVEKLSELVGEWWEEKGEVTESTTSEESLTSACHDQSRIDFCNPCISLIYMNHMCCQRYNWR